MNYEKIIVELLARIQTLEEKVDMLMNDKSTGSGSVTHEETVNNVVKVKTKDIRDFIEAQKIEAKNRGEEFIVLRASDLHRTSFSKENKYYYQPIDRDAIIKIYTFHKSTDFTDLEI